MDRTLYFHIGDQKTGSTSIQKALESHKDRRIFRLLPPFYAGKARTGRFGNSWVQKGDDDAKITAHIHPALSLAISETNPKGDVIFSAEDMSWVFSKEEIANFYEEIHPHFSEIKIIAYLRRQDRNAVSLYQEALKPHPMRFSRFAGTKARSLPKYQPHFDLLFDYNERLGKWADVFGDEALCVFNFEDIVKGEGLLPHFSRIIGIPLEGQIFERRSHSRIRQQLNLRIVKNKFNVSLPYEASQRELYGDKMTPPRHEAIAFYEHFKESNLRLNERFSISDRPYVFDEDFSDYSEAGNENWDQESADMAVDFLLARLWEAQREIENLKRSQKSKEPKKTKVW